MDNKLTYLASPYSSKDPAVVEERFEAICKVSSILMMRGEFVFSPIAHCHPIAMAGSLPKDFAWWQAYDHRMIDACDSFAIVTLPGYEDSVGVNGELACAINAGKPVMYIDIDGNQVEHN